MGPIPVRVIFCLLEVVRKLVGCADCHARPSLTTTLLAGNDLNEENCDQKVVVNQLLESNNRLHARFRRSESQSREKERHIEK